VGDPAVSRPCSACARDDVLDIERAYIASGNITTVAKQFGLGRDVVRRHCTRHLQLRLAQAGEAAEALNGDALLAEIRLLMSHAVGLRRMAKKAGRLRDAVAAQREVRGALTLLASVKNELPTTGNVTINLFASTEFRTLASALLGALEPYPLAREAAAGVLHKTTPKAIANASSDAPEA
jgi:hypothetical protein